MLLRKLAIVSGNIVEVMDLLLAGVAVKFGRLYSGIIIDGAFTDTFDVVMLVLYPVKVFDDTMLAFDNIMVVVNTGNVVFENVYWVTVKFELFCNTVFCLNVTVVDEMKVELCVTIFVELSRVDVGVKFEMLDTAAVMLREERDILDTVAVAVDTNTTLEEFITAVKELLNIVDEIR